MQALVIDIEDFLKDSLSLPQKLSDLFNRQGIYFSKKELDSWGNNACYLYNLLINSSLPQGTKLIFEYQIPGFRKRIDVMLVGVHNNITTIYVIELKMWDRIANAVGLPDEVWAGMKRMVNPVIQINNYLDIFEQSSLACKNEQIKVVGVLCCPNVPVDKLFLFENINNRGILIYGKECEFKFSSELENNFTHSVSDISFLEDANWLKSPKFYISKNDPRIPYLLDLVFTKYYSTIDKWFLSNPSIERPENLEEAVTRTLTLTIRKYLRTHYQSLYDSAYRDIKSLFARYKKQVKPITPKKTIKNDLYSHTPYSFIVYCDHFKNGIPSIRTLQNHFDISHGFASWNIFCYKIQKEKGRISVETKDDCFLFSLPNIDKSLLANNIRKLYKSSRRADIFISYYGSEGDEKNLDELAVIYLRSRERIRQLVDKVSLVVSARWDELV